MAVGPTPKALYSPRFYLALDGKSDEALSSRIISFSYTEREAKADELEFTLSNKDLSLQDDPRLATGTSITARWGYPNEVSDTKSLVITEVGLLFPAGVPTIAVSAQDERRELNKVSSSKNWGSVSSSDVAAQIALKYGYRLEAAASKDTRKEARVQPSGVTDVQYLKSLAEDLNWDFYIEGGVLHFHEKRMTAAPDATYTYYTDRSGGLLKFDISLNLKKLTSTGAIGADPQTGEVVAADADATSIGDSRNGEKAVLLYTEPGLGVYGPVYSPSSESNQSVVDLHAKARQSKIEEGALTAEAEFVGNPRIRSRSNLFLEGLGRTYSGLWRVAEASHLINPTGKVYITRCKVTKNAVGLGTEDASVTSGGNSAAEPRSVTIYTEPGLGVYSP